MEWVELFAKVKVIETLVGLGFLVLILVLGLGSIIVDFVSNVIRRTKRAADLKRAVRKSDKSTKPTISNR